MQKQIFKILFLLVIFLMLPNFTKAADKLLQSSDLTYLGGFRVPQGDLNSGHQYQGLGYGGSVITFNPANNSLFITGHDANQQVAEIGIPTPINTSNINAMNTAPVIQNLFDITEGNLNNIAAGRSDCYISKSYPGNDPCYGNGAKIGGLLVYNNKILGTSYSYYDGGANALYSHFLSGKDFSVSGDFQGMFEVGSKPTEVPQAGFVAGYMSQIPLSWQSKLGGTVLTGQGGLSVLGRTSAGPALFAFNPNDLNSSSPAPATPLLYYNLTSNNCILIGGSAGGDVCDNENIGAYSNADTLYKGGTSLSGAVFPSGSRSVLVSGKYGTGEACYGFGNKTGMAGGVARTTNVTNGEIIAWMDANSNDNFPCGDTVMARSYVTGNSHQCCYDPANENPGAHAYPYLPYIWAYDAEDLARIKTGGRIVDDPSPNLVTPIIENGKVLRPGVLPTSTEVYKPWDIKPYASWAISLPTTQNNYTISSGASAYDEATGRLYISQIETDDQNPIIHVFQVNMQGTSDVVAPASPTGVNIQ